MEIDTTTPTHTILTRLQQAQAASDARQVLFESTGTTGDADVDLGIEAIRAATTEVGLSPALLVDFIRTRLAESNE